jgi:ABC-type multidrug transport system fused ATPase/permease subunit
VVIAEFTLGHALLTTLSIFFFVIWIWILITILSDLFRDHELSGWWKALWVLFLVVIPFLAALIYLIARGNGMRDRTIKAQAEAKQQFDDYVRSTAGGSGGGASTADELSKLAGLKNSGTITEEEFQAQKAKLLG